MLRRLIAATVAVCCLLPATALASGSDVHTDCSDHGRLTKRYTQKEYRDALANMPTDLDEYTNCRDLIKRAQLGQGAGTGTSGNQPDTSAGPIRDPYVGAGATPEETAAATRDVAAATRSGSGSQAIGSATVRPGALAYRDLAAISKLPSSLVVLSILLLGSTLAVGGYLIRDRVRARHRD